VLTFGICFFYYYSTMVVGFVKHELIETEMES